MGILISFGSLKLPLPLAKKIFFDEGPELHLSMAIRISILEDSGQV